MACRTVRLAYARAKGQNRKETLIERFGGNVLMPEVRRIIA
jgi:hypothetical protein